MNEIDRLSRQYLTEQKTLCAYVSWTIAQRIFYVHVPAAWTAFMAIVISALCSAMYLWLRDDKLDRAAVAAAEGGIVFATIVLLTGPLWGKIAWGTYWQWDPKETWSLITWFLYAGLLHGRLTIGWRGRKAAVWSIIGFGSVIFTFLGVNYVLPMIIPNLESLHIYTGSL